MLKKFDWVIIGLGAVAAGTGAQLIFEHIDKTEGDKASRTFKKIGVYCGCAAFGGLMASVLEAGNLAEDLRNGKIHVEVISKIGEIVA